MAEILICDDCRRVGRNHPPLGNIIPQKEKKGKPFLKYLKIFIALCLLKKLWCPVSCKYIYWVKELLSLNDDKKVIVSENSGKT